MAKSTATPQQKWTGRNCSNNKVYVDFVNKTVRFLPVDGRPLTYWWFYQMMQGLVHIFMIWIYWVALPAMIWTLVGMKWIQHTPDYIINYYMNLLLFTPLIIWGLWGIVTTFTKFMDEDWRHYDFPKWNAMCISVSTRMRGQTDGGWTKRRVNWKAIQDKKFVIRDCSNIALEYQATKDFATYLKSITIQNAYLKDDTEWVCIFEWTQNPRKGGLTLEYI